MYSYLIRHQESLGNIEGMIQGKEYDTPLTREGAANAAMMADRLKDIKGKGADNVISSPSKRALQTAYIIADTLDLKVIQELSLSEQDTGILQDSSKKKNEELNPCYMSIYKRRGDLDEIPGAEKGDEVQARAIYFLERYFENQSPEIIVSHAGFNRCLQNTAMGRQRNTPIPHEHNKIHTIQNPWQYINTQRLELAKASEAYRITTEDQRYVMKRIFGASVNDLQFQSQVSRLIAEEGDLLSRVLYWGVKDGKGVQVLNYLSGEHVYGMLSERKRQNLIEASFDLANRLTKIPLNIVKNYNTLIEKIDRSVSKVEDSRVKEIGKKLLNNPNFKRIITEKEHMVVHYDLHRSNVLFNSDDSVKILDLGSMTYAPRDFLPASLFMSSFLLEEGDNFSLENMIHNWPDKLNKKDIVILMQARIFIGASFFEKKLVKDKYLKEDYDIFQRYINALDIIERKYGE